MNRGAYRHFLMQMRFEQRMKDLNGEEMTLATNQFANGKSRQLTLIDAEIEILKGLDSSVDYCQRRDQLLKRLERASRPPDVRRRA